MELRGPAGRLTQAGRLAAELGAWTATPTPAGGLTVTARVRAADNFWLTAPGPARLELTIGARQRAWRATVQDYDGRTLILQAQGGPDA